MIGYCITSCKKDQYTNVSSQTLNTQYFPLKKGDSIIYKLDSLKYNIVTNVIDTYQYYLLQYIQDTFTDGSGRLAYKLNRLWKREPLDSWQQANVWQEQIVSNSSQTVEENIRYERLIFPIGNGISWNGNAYNNIDTNQWYNYNYVNAFKPWTGTYKSYDSTVTVNQINTASQNSSTFNYIFRIYGYEVYAANVGLVYKVFKYANYSQEQVDMNNDTTGITGYGEIMTIQYCSYHK